MSERGPVEEWLLGFDVRELGLDVGREWPESRRGLYLLREDVRKPLAVDTAVWPSLFGEGLPGSECERLGLREAELPAWRGPNAPLWDDLERMKGCLETLGAVKEEPHALIAVSVYWDGRPAEGTWPGVPYRERTMPSVRGDGWRFLGFDVGDGGLISGLGNCGYTEPEAPELRRQWAGRLNEHHLLGELEQALAFRELSDRRVPEHAPFFVWGLWLIDAVGMR
ncbi:hypothetical protein [Archangium lipolyticum]|uniref:hypothetical protein n=1 Tax=Archangium lipolyticum TaxID=2970465 RepID=UPI00214A65E6|nr:hypothetical protein [Archangium lipolyticum]